VFYLQQGRAFTGPGSGARGGVTGRENLRVKHFLKSGFNRGLGNYNLPLCLIVKWFILLSNRDR